ncbi:MAG: FprA family A-type flavoprotein [Coriobacteriia bacterium]|nr:FprA family A-type flavoprotein [Coriobacteriia bacterium]
MITPAKDTVYIGVNDHEIDLFEGQYDVTENGMAYNSYVILDEKIAVMDTVDANFGEEWMANLTAALDGRTPDYLVVQHMEPDHSSNITRFMDAFPAAQVVSNAKSFPLMQKLFGVDYPDRRIAVKDGDTLELGTHTLSFVGAMMVHWPEVIMTYDAATGVLFSADAFGKFGALDVDEDWACEARRYYFGIVGKFGAQVQKVLAKAATLDVKAILPLHGPLLTENLDYYLDLYNTWSSYGVETEGVFIAYTSVYGHTKEAAELVAAKLEAAGCPKVAIADLAREDMAECVEDAFRYGKVVLATTTYNGGIFPFMHDFISHLQDHNYQNKFIGLVQNGLWGPTAAKGMKAALEPCKNLTFAETTVTVNGALDQEARAQIDALVAELMA